eukprot:gene16819-17000_t
MKWSFPNLFTRSKPVIGFAQPGRRIYAIGDIHGELELFEHMLSLITDDIAARPCAEPIVIFLGDYIDRGLNSAAVLERLATGSLPGVKHYFLKGNHEQLFAEFLESPLAGASWLQYGGLETAFSYGVVPQSRDMDDAELQRFGERIAQAVPSSHKSFLKSLSRCVEIDGYFFTHAGVRPGVPLAQQRSADLLWIRDLFLDYDGLFEKVIVHGHSPREEPESLPGRINVDTGAYATHRLTAVVLEDESRAFISSGWLWFAVSSCDGGAGIGAASVQDQKNMIEMAATTSPTLQPGDKIKVTVFGEDRLSGEFEIDPAGFVSLPLAGTVKAAGLSKQQLEQALAKKFKSEYLRDPKVTVDVSSFKPFYILGEVGKPGEYPFKGGLNLMSAIALAGGTTYRASRSTVMIKHSGDSDFKEYPLTPAIPIVPGDLIRTAVAQDASVASAPGGPSPDKGLVIADWILYPSITAATVFNDNVNRTATNKKSQVGFDFNPSFEMYRDAGIQKTNIFASFDAQFYNSAVTANNFQGTFGFGHTIEIEKDLVFKINADFSRQIGSVGSVNSNPATSSTAATLGAMAVTSSPANQINGSASLEKQFGRGFVRVEGSALDYQYDNASLKAQNNYGYGTAARFGYWVTPLLNVFVEPSAQFRTFRVSGLNTQTYGAVAGVSTDQVGLFRGEIYGGYQTQQSSTNIAGASSAPTFGGRVSYYPTPYLTFIGAVDHDFAVSAPTLTTAQSASSTRATLTGEYALSSYWAANARFGYGYSHYNQSRETDRTLVAGLGLDYRFWRNLDVKLGYQYSKLDSHVANASYQQDLYTVGLNYHY